MAVAEHSEGEIGTMIGRCVSVATYLTPFLCMALGALAPRSTTAQPRARPQPENIGTLWASAIAAADSGRIREYRRLMARAAALAPHPGVLFHLARANALTGRPNEALALLDRLAAMGLAHFEPADTAFRAIAKRSAFARVAARLAANRHPIIASDTAFTIPGPDRIPENIAFDSVTGTFFLGSLAERSIVRVRPSASPQSFADADDGLLRVVGMKVDRPRGRLWAATWAPVVDSARLATGFDTETRLFAFDLESGRRLLTLLPSDTTRPHLLNDLVVTPTGDVYLTDTNEGAIYRVRAGADTLERVARPDAARFNYPNGIALSRDGTRLYVAFAEGIARLDLTTGRLRYLAVPPTVTTASVDGLYWFDGNLVAVQMASSVERVVRFVLDPAGWRVLRADVLERAHPAYRLPTTGAVVRDSLYYVANPGWDRLDDSGRVKPAETPSPTVILRLPLRPSPRRVAWLVRQTRP